MIDKNFYGFEAVSFEEWLAKVESDLKGKSFDTLTQDVNEDVQIKPIYKRNLKRHIDEPGQFPFLRSAKEGSNTFRLEQSYNVNNESANKLILEALKNGAESIQLEGNLNSDNLERALKGVHKDFIWLGAGLGADKDSLQALLTVTNGQVFLNVDPILSSQVSVEDCLSMHQSENNSYWLCANGSKIANAGGDEVQELTYLLAAGNEYLHTLIETGLTVDQASARISFSTGLGSNFVSQIAKVRAFRVLWANLVKLYQPKNDNSMSCWIHGETVSWNKLTQDSNNNMLRATTEAISGVLGGVDSLAIHPLNLSQNNEAHNYRIARNIVHLIEEESYLSDVIDPLGGSYLIENLTEELAQAAWKSFKEIEAKGGIQNYLPQLKTEIQVSRNQRIEEFENGTKSLIGANKFAPKGGENWSSKELNFIEL